MYEKIIFNVSGPTRTEVLEGRDYIVAPMVMLVEGVVAGSMGPLYYPREELSKTPVVWNSKPIVVNHPKINGQHVSACDPVIMNSRKIGMIMNAKVEGNEEDGNPFKLKAEGWFERSRVEVVDKRVLEALNTGAKMEVSTGVFTDNESIPGEYKGKKYDAIARNYRPDHLAILPDTEGACSVADGAGLNANSKIEVKTQEELDKLIEEAKKASNPAIAKGKIISIANAKGLKLPETWRKSILVESFVLNDSISFDNIRSAVCKALEAKIPKIPDPYDPSYMMRGFWIMDLYEDFVVYEDTSAKKLMMQSYSMSGMDAALEGFAEEVKQVTEYRTVADGSYVGNAATSSPKEKRLMATKKEKVDALIANGDKTWTEQDREWLMAVPDNQLEKLTKPPAPPVGTVTTANTAPVIPQPVPAPQPSAVTQPAAPMALNSYLATLPPEVRGPIEEGIAMRGEEKVRLVNAIIANQNNPFPKERLEGMTLADLRSLSALAGPNIPANAHQPLGLGNDYSGAWTPSGVVGNQKAEIPVLDAPTMNEYFAPKKAS